MTPDIQRAISQDELAACLSLRAEVFITEQGVSEAEERDGRDPEATHLLAKIDGRPVGTLRIRFLDDTAKLERVCVARSARGIGLGAALTLAALDVARDMPNVSRAKLGAQVPVIGFYEKLGFVAEGPEYLDAGIPHRDMARTL